MAVFTKIPTPTLHSFIAGYTLGPLVEASEIAEGIENTNYLIRTATTRAILTLFEKRVPPDDLPFFMGYMQHLAGKGIACPTPIPDAKGAILHQLCGKHAAMVTFLNGKQTPQITPVHCAGLGAKAAQMHLAGADFSFTRVNGLSPAGWETLVAANTPRADSIVSGLAALLQQEYAELHAQWPKDTALPRGAVHADLFPDNVFFDGDTLCGVIDFYLACTDFYAYDLAICVNAWCFDAAHVFQPDRAAAMVEAYQKIRPLSAAEKTAFLLLLRGAALRFLLTRTYDLLNHPEGALVTPKDPLEYRNKLVFFKNNPAAIRL
jgi:homoserine kinase type II